MSARGAGLGIVLTVAALVAFAANSILCRLALGTQAIDPSSFTLLRLASGALVLALIGAVRRGVRDRPRPAWSSSALLVLYAVPFALAYTRLTTGTGALLLFGAVQLTMIGQGFASGHRPRSVEWLALLGALAGVVYLVAPGLTAPDPLAAALMVAAGVGWGGYTIAGKATPDPASATALNFRRATLLVLPVLLLAAPSLALSARGIALALTSGALASGLGYAVWYAALDHLTVTRAALVQLAVPVLAAGGGVAFIGEVVTSRLAIASVVILGSIALGIIGRRETANGPWTRNETEV